MERIRWRSRLIALFALVVPTLLASAFGPHPGYAQAQRRSFPETGKTIAGGFLNYWTTHGGLAQFGYPISDETAETSDTDGKTYTVQYFERGVFEYHPQNRPPNDVLLSLLGVFQYKALYQGAAPGQRPNREPGSVYFDKTGKRVGAKFNQYWKNHGGLSQQGYPISDEFPEISSLDGKPYLVQYFQRAVFEYHPENKAPYDVLLSQLGTFQYRARYGTSGAPNPQPGVWQTVNSPNDGTQANIVMGVAPVSQNDAWAVGVSSVVAQGGKALAEHWDGKSWSLVPSPRVSLDPYGFLGVAAVSAHEVWGVGEYYSGPNQYTLIERWNGTAWEEVTHPNPNIIGGSILSGVAAIGENDIWAAGDYNMGAAYIDKTLAEHWDGQNWRIVNTPNQPGFNYLNGVAGAASNDVWAVGWSSDDLADLSSRQALILHWDGSRWTVVQVPDANPPGASSAFLEGVSAASPNNVWAVGAYVTNGIYRTLALHWDGQTWKVVPSYYEPSAAYSDLHGVWASGQDVWAIGAYSIDLDATTGQLLLPTAYRGSQTLILHWNGKSLERVNSPNLGIGSQITAIAGLRTGAAWAAGSYRAGDDSPDKTLLERFVP